MEYSSKYGDEFEKTFGYFCINHQIRQTLMLNLFARSPKLSFSDSKRYAYLQSVELIGPVSLTSMVCQSPEKGFGSLRQLQTTRPAWSPSCPQFPIYYCNTQLLASFACLCRIQTLCSRRSGKVDPDTFQRRHFGFLYKYQKKRSKVMSMELNCKKNIMHTSFYVLLRRQEHYGQSFADADTQHSPHCSKNTKARWIFLLKL